MSSPVRCSTHRAACSLRSVPPASTGPAVGKFRAARASPLIADEHEYPHRRVLLDLWVVTRFSGEPQPLDAPALQWAAIEDLERIGLLAADLPMIPALAAYRRR